MPVVVETVGVRTQVTAAATMVTRSVTAVLCTTESMVIRPWSACAPYGVWVGVAYWS